ncbi:hypothetical protein [Nocardia abscessus]|uniref:hypothetical protein n=1 Tax=Nocardia abscessus TaxID=120957 RepID=UPI002457B5A1|nr:hypothetical protein [Nocardia abscessus]
MAFVFAIVLILRGVTPIVATGRPVVVVAGGGGGGGGGRPPAPGEYENERGGGWGGGGAGGGGAPPAPAPGESILRRVVRVLAALAGIDRGQGPQ